MCWLRRKRREEGSSTSHARAELTADIVAVSYNSEDVDLDPDATTVVVDWLNKQARTDRH